MITEGNGLHFQTLKFERSVVRFTVSENNNAMVCRVQ
jgi:hypothetical protein